MDNLGARQRTGDQHGCFAVRCSSADSRFDAEPAGHDAAAGNRGRRRAGGPGTGRGPRRRGQAPQEEKKKITLCFNDSTIKKKKKKFLKRGATAGACPDCTPDCATCDGPDGCGGTSGCATGQICADGTCVACASTLPASVPAGTVYLCAGTYTGPFTFDAATTLIGVGNGSNPATSTILQGDGASRVMSLVGGAAKKLANLRVTGGVWPGGAGMEATNGHVTLENCAITDNTATGNSDGGGILTDADMTIVDCQIFDNAANSGGGMGVFGAVTITNTLIRDNEANGLVIGLTAGLGGGILVGSDGMVTLDATVTMTGNSAAVSGGGVAAIEDGEINLNGASVSGNSAPAFPDCVDNGVACQA